MKKSSILALIATMALGLASCNRQEIDPPREGVRGKYLLTEITAYTEDDDTKTGVVSNSATQWYTNDKIAVKGTDGALHLYVIKVGANTTVGKFIPASGQTPASYNSLSDLTAIYPACAAELTGGELYVNINNLDLSSNYSEKGLNYWTSDSPFSFTNNDIKVAIPNKTSQDGVGRLNFKFKQLGTCCGFRIDFRQAEQATSLKLESVERIQITTLEGVALGGRAKVSGTTLGAITNPVTSINWALNITSPMSGLIKPTFVFFPEVTANTTLRITLTTTNHEFVFTGKPNQDFEAGKWITFPIIVDKNFTRGGSQLAYTSSVRVPADQFYYYGGTNCLLIPTTNTLGYLDVTQYVTDSRWHNTKNTVDIITHKPAAYAKIIWSEGSDVIANDMVDATNDYKLKLIGSAVGSADAISTDAYGKSTLTIKRGSAAGNALVGIYDSGDNLLWSYHIWCPEDDPADNLCVFTRTHSGQYTVLTMPIGATKKAIRDMPNPEKAAGLFFQWGRKDPQGRISTYVNNTSNSKLVEVLGPDQSSPFSEGNLKDCMIWFAHNDNTSEHNTLKNAWDTSDKSKSLARFMLDYSVSNPWMSIQCMSDAYVSSWMPFDVWLWGNGYAHATYPSMDDTFKSIFDPSPEGFRVTPEDIMVGMTSTMTAQSVGSSWTEDEKEAFVSENFNVVSTVFNNANNANGYDFYYQGWKTGPSVYLQTVGQMTRDGFPGNCHEYVCTWNSASCNTKGSSVSIAKGWVWPLFSDHACRGYSVYCVKEY